MTGLNPLNWYGTEFLILYGTLFVVACIVSWWVEYRLRPKGQGAQLRDPDEIAVLGSGRARLAEAAVAQMLQRGDMRVEKKSLWIESHAQPQTRTEHAIAALASPVSFGQIDRAVAAEASEIERRLVARRLMLPRGDALSLGFSVATPFLMLICFGLAKLLLGVDRDMPVGFLTLFLVVTGIVALLRLFGAGRKTKAGKRALVEARAEADRLRMAPTGPETGMAVALFGTAVIATSPFGDFHRMRESSGGSGDGGGSDGDGGSGCGGGCGGCGG